MIDELKIEVIATGNELLDGTTSDTNTAELARALRKFGLKIESITVVRDSERSISEVLARACTRSRIVVISGGLGPTSDDITLGVAAKTFGVSLVKNKLALQNVLRRLRHLKRAKLNAGRLKQSFIPEGSEVLANDEGTAPAVRWNVGDRILFFLPGVPREYLHVLNRHLIPFFEKQKADLSEYLFVLKVFGWPESELNELMKKMKVPAVVTVGYRYHFPENHLKFQVQAKSFAQAKKIVDPLLKSVQKKLGEACFSDGDKNFEEAFLHELKKQKKTVAVAESCTGGLVTSMITRVAGSSDILDRGFVTYSYESKEQLLGVKRKTLQKYGAVSEQVVIEMVKGALQNSKADKAVAITGIAGPAGGLPKKPVGTVWVACATRGSKKIKTHCLQLGFQNRAMNQLYSAYFAMEMLKTA